MGAKPRWRPRPSWRHSIPRSVGYRDDLETYDGLEIVADNPIITAWRRHGAGRFQYLKLGVIDHE
jgi:hypothetical protein